MTAADKSSRALEDNLKEAWYRYHDSEKALALADKAVLAAERGLDRRREERARAALRRAQDEVTLDALRARKAAANAALLSEVSA